MRELINRFADWLRRDRLDRELAEELRFHHARAEEDAIADGADADGASWVARRRFGNATAVREAARDLWSIPALEQMLQDARYAIRGLRRSPGYTATAVVVLALGIGANVAMFGVVDRLMFRPYPYLRDPARVHRLYLQATFRGKLQTGLGDEYTRYLDFRRFTTAFSELAGFGERRLAVGSGDLSRERWVGTVSGSFWRFFDAPPALGRYFTDAEDTPPRGAEVAVVSYEFWKNELGGRNVVGQQLLVSNIPTTIIGVTPRGFTGVFEPNAPAVYIPITLYGGSAPPNEDRATYYRQYHWGWMRTMVRRKKGVSEAQANADVTQAFRRSWQAELALEPSTEPLELARPNGIAGPMKTAAGPTASLEARTALWVLGVAVIVLLIACANVANLALARALRRERETAVRLALGVSRGRLVAQRLTESLLLSLLGAAGGLLFAQWGGAAIERILIDTTQASLETFTDWRTLAVAAAIAVACGVLAGVVPGFAAGRANVASSLRGGVREGTHQRSRLRVALLVAQAALSVVLLVGAALFVKSLRHVRDVRMGYDAAPVLIVQTNLRGTALDSVQLSALRAQMVARAEATPGVLSAAWASGMPIWSSSSTGLYVAGIDSVARIGRFTYEMVTANYFATAGTRVVRGRGFTPEDRAGAPLVAVVSESMGRALWPGRDPIGQCMRVRHDTEPCTTIVGVAEDMVQRQEQLTDGGRYQYYLPSEQTARPTTGFLFVRMEIDPASQIDALRKSLQSTMPGQAYVTVDRMQQVVDATRRSWRLGADLFVVFGVLALVVAAVGLYGVMAYSVAQRKHELGVRAALGASRGDIVRLVAGQGARLAASGVALGIALAFAAGRWVQPLLFQQSAHDPLVYLAVAAVMLAVALAASAVPARRASGVDPNLALRSE